jgi:DNA repair exonuclease SbcCD ATPase subunit
MKAVLALSLLTVLACEQQTKDDDKATKDVEPTKTAGEKVEDVTVEIGADARAALDRADARLEALDQRLEKARLDAKAKQRQINQELEREVAAAQTTAKAKAEAASRAAAGKISAAVDDLEAALADLEEKIQKYEGPGDQQHQQPGTGTQQPPAN